MSEDQLSRLCSWLLKLVDFGVIEIYDYDSTLGHAYGYKKCCIKNYMNLTKLGFPNPAEWMWENIDKRIFYDNKFNYVPCVTCVEEYYE